MDKTMLVEANYNDEVRVAVVNEKSELENFEIESKNKSNTKGNIYLAKVLRIEPSLQAVFVDYGNERQGFLSFSNIHPDYYQIPVSVVSHTLPFVSVYTSGLSMDYNNYIHHQLMELHYYMQFHSCTAE